MSCPEGGAESTPCDTWLVGSPSARAPGSADRVAPKYLLLASPCSPPPGSVPPVWPPATLSPACAVQAVATNDCRQCDKARWQSTPHPGTTAAPAMLPKMP